MGKSSNLLFVHVFSMTHICFSSMFTDDCCVGSVTDLPKFFLVTAVGWSCEEEIHLAPQGDGLGQHFDCLHRKFLHAGMMLLCVCLLPWAATGRD